MTTRLFPQAWTLPPEWRRAKLSDVVLALETGKRPKGGAVNVSGGILSISAEHMTASGEIDRSIPRFVPREFYESMRSGRVQLGDVLVVKDGATTGKTAFVCGLSDKPPMAVNEHVFICRPDGGSVDPQFLFFWLWGPSGQYQIRACYRGSAIGGINRSFAEHVTIPLPPLAEQKRIVAILNDQMAAVKAC